MDLISSTISGVLFGLPALVPALAVTLLGALVSRALGLRDVPSILVISTPVAIGSLTATAQLLGWAGLGGLRLTVGVLAGACVLAPVVARTPLGTRLSRHRADPPVTYPLPLTVWLAAAFGGLCGLAAWLPGIGEVGLPPQGNDDIWHGYLATRLTEMPLITADRVAPVVTGSADPVTVYPYGIHLALGVAQTVTGSSIPLAMNGMWAVYAGLLVPIGVALLSWRLFPAHTLTAAVAAVSALLFNAFPYALNGVMPYTVTLSMVPGLLAVVVGRMRSTVATPSLVIAMAILGIFASHPAVAVVAVVLGVLVAAETLVGLPTRLPALGRMILPAFLAVLVCLPWVVRSRSLGAAATGAAASPGTGEGYTLARAVEMVLLQATPWTPGQPALAVLVVVGALAVLVRRRGWSLLAGYLCFAALFVAVLAGIPVLARLTGPWYGNWHRLIAVSVLVAPVIVGLGMSGAADLVRWATALSRRPVAVRAIASVAMVGALVVTVESAKYLARGQSTVSTAWQSVGLVTEADVRLFRRLAAITDNRPAVQVLNNWPDGSTWMYAVAGVRPAIPYQPTTALIPTWSAALNPTALSENPNACRLLIDNNVEFALGKRFGLDGTGGTLEASLGAAPGLFEPIFANSGGTVFRVSRTALEDCAAQAQASGGAQ